MAVSSAIASIYLIGCAPEHPETIATAAHEDGSPPVVVIGSHVLTRKGILDEIDGLPIWLQARYVSSAQRLTFAQAALNRAVFFNEGLRRAYDKDPLTVAAYQLNVLHETLSKKSRFPQPTWEDRVAYLSTDEGKSAFDQRPLYYIRVASKELADQIAADITGISPEKRVDAFQKAVRLYSLDYVAEHDSTARLQDDLKEKEDAETSSRQLGNDHNDHEEGQDHSDALEKKEEKALSKDGLLGLVTRDLLKKGDTSSDADDMSGWLLRGGRDDDGDRSLADPDLVGRQVLENTIGELSTQVEPEGETGTLYGPGRVTQPHRGWVLVVIGPWAFAADRARHHDSVLNLTAIDRAILFERGKKLLVESKE